MQSDLPVNKLNSFLTVSTKTCAQSLGDSGLTTGIDQIADIRAEDCVLSDTSSRFTLKTPSGSCEVHTRLLGRHNIYNLLSGAGAAHAQGFSLDEIQKGLEAISHVSTFLSEFCRRQCLQLDGWAEPPTHAFLQGQ